MSAEDKFYGTIEAMLCADPHVKTAFGTGLKIYGAKPGKEVFPYVVLKVRRSEEIDALSLRLTLVTYRESKADIVRYLNAFEAAMLSGPLDMPGHPITARRVRLRDIFSDDSCKTREGILHVRFQLNSIKNNGNN